MIRIKDSIQISFFIKKVCDIDFDDFIIAFNQKKTLWRKLHLILLIAFQLYLCWQ
jgi:hypothetical protein